MLKGTGRCLTRLMTILMKLLLELSRSVSHLSMVSLTGKPITSLHQLMDRVDKYKMIEDDQQQRKREAKVIPQEMRDFRSDRYSNNRPRRDYIDQSRSNNTQVVGAVFRKLVHQVLEKIKNEPFFKRPNKMVGNPEK